MAPTHNVRVLWRRNRSFILIMGILVLLVYICFAQGFGWWLPWSKHESKEKFRVNLTNPHPRYPPTTKKGKKVLKAIEKDVEKIPSIVQKTADTVLSAIKSVGTDTTKTFVDTPQVVVHHQKVHHLAHRPRHRRSSYLRMAHLPQCGCSPKGPSHHYFDRRRY